MANHTITAAKGFWATGVSCGVKKSGSLDLGLIYCPSSASAAALFTTNRIVSASVEICRKHLSSRGTGAIVINSGNANTCTGYKGLADAMLMCKTVAGKLGIEPNQVLIASTGIIGHPLPVNKIVSGIKKAAGLLSDSPAAGLDFAKAIMTTDTRPKQTVARISINGTEVTIAGTAKGAGMIGPNMATTICVLTTDAAIEKPLLQRALKHAIGQSLNRLTVDGHQSTNDTAIILASGLAGNRPITSPCPRFKRFQNALTQLCGDLARQMALDAEGATRMFKVQVNGASNNSQAAKAARAIADYDLVKCAVRGGDPNWGRIICAAGSCGVKLDPARLTCKIGDVTVFSNGKPRPFDKARLSRIIRQRQHTITLNLGVGKGSDFCCGCDLGPGYITINADYHT